MFYVKWHNTSEELPEIDLPCVVLRGSCMCFDFYHGEDLWSAAWNAPDKWAEWKFSMGEPFSQERFDILASIVRPGQENTGLDDWGENE